MINSVDNLLGPATPINRAVWGYGPARFFLDKMVTNHQLNKAILGLSGLAGLWPKAALLVGVAAPGRFSAHNLLKCKKFLIFDII